MNSQEIVNLFESEKVIEARVIRHEMKSNKIIDFKIYQLSYQKSTDPKYLSGFIINTCKGTGEYIPNSRFIFNDDKKTWNLLIVEEQEH